MKIYLSLFLLIISLNVSSQIDSCYNYKRSFFGDSILVEINIEVDNQNKFVKFINEKSKTVLSKVYSFNTLHRETYNGNNINVVKTYYAGGYREEYYFREKEKFLTLGFNTQNNLTSIKDDNMSLRYNNKGFIELKVINIHNDSISVIKHKYSNIGKLALISKYSNEAEKIFKKLANGEWGEVYQYKKTGMWTYYDSTGIINKKEYYNDGDLIKIEK